MKIYRYFLLVIKDHKLLSAVKDLMNDPISINIDASISDVIKKLLAEKISRLLVSDNKVESIVTERDLGFFLFSDQTDRALEDISVSEIIKPLFSVDLSTSIMKCAQTMLENSMGSLTVRHNNSIVGILTKTDLTKYYAEKFAGKKMVGEYMSPYYAWAYSDTPLYRVVQKMLEEKISRIILRNKQENPEGILTYRDLFRISLDLGNEKTTVDNPYPNISVVFNRKGFVSKTGFGGTTIAKQIMTSKIISVNYDDDLAQTCQILLDNKINGAGVLSGKSNLFGIISKTDITRAIAFMH